MELFCIVILCDYDTVFRIAATSRMSDADVDNFVQLRRALEKFAEVLQKAAS